MGRRLLVVAALVACGVLVYRLRQGGTAPSRAGSRPLETVRDAPPDTPEPGAERAEPAVLRGRVFGLSNTPIAKAEVSVLVPRTHDLVRTGEDGAYELPFERAGEYLVEAALTSEYAPSRVWVEVPVAGDPAPRDFHLEPAGTLFGEVTMGGLPVRYAGVELYAQGASGSEELLRDTTAGNGYFSFPFAPPEGVPLRVDATSDEGFLRESLFVTYRGTPLNLGKLELVPYPALRFTMRLPDGRVAEDVRLMRREQIEVDAETRRAYATLWPDEHSHIVVAARKDVRPRMLFASLDGRGNDPDFDRDVTTLYLVEREIPLAVGQPREIELVIRPGPLRVTSRLVDNLDRPQRGRVALGRDESEVAADGTFTVVAPHGGVVPVWLVAWEIPGKGLFGLDPLSREHALLLDLDEGAPCRMDLDARVVGLATAPCELKVESDPPRPMSDNKAWWWWSLREPAGGEVACLSHRLRPGTYRWRLWRGNGAGAPADEGKVTVPGKGFVVLDAR